MLPKGSQEREQVTIKELASIAKMYIFAACRGYPCPQCRLRADGFRGLGPQKGASMKRKNNMHHLHIELTPEQYETLTEKAKQCGLTKRALIVRLVEGQKIRERPNEEIRQLRTEIHRIGNNINQIARSVNMGIADPADTRRAVQLLDEIYERLYQIGA